MMGTRLGKAAVGALPEEPRRRPKPPSKGVLVKTRKKVCPKQRGRSSDGVFPSHRRLPTRERWADAYQIGRPSSAQGDRG